MKQQKAEQDREEAEMKIAEVKWNFSFNYSAFEIIQLYNSFHVYACHYIVIAEINLLFYLYFSLKKIFKSVVMRLSERPGKRRKLKRS